MVNTDIKHFFTPSSIALFGASKDPSKIGGKTLTNLLEFENNVKIYPINPRYDIVMGLSCYPDLKSVKGTVDVALIAVSGKQIIDAMKQCIDKQVKFAVIFTSGFAEIGETGQQMQDELLKLCKENGLRFAGPNTMGCMNYIDGIPLSFGRIGKYHLKGSTGLISQSGAIGNTITEHLMDEKVGFSYLASLGNQADLSIVDLIEFMNNDENTKVISIYMESVKNAEKLKSVSEAALRKHKPIVLLKAGRSSLGQKAALSHTASMTGSDAGFRSFAERYGIVQVKDIGELLNAVKIFNRGKRPNGKRVAIISTSGASCILFADHCSELGLEIPSFSEETVKRLKEVMPDFGTVQNPLDVTGAALTDKNLFKSCLDIISADKEIDALMVDTNFGYDLGLRMAKEIVEIDKMTDKPIVVCYTSGEPVEEARNYLKQHQIPTFTSQWQTTESLKMLIDYEENYRNLQSLSNQKPVKLLAELDWIKEYKKKAITEPEVKKILSALGITTPNGSVGCNLNEVLKISEQLTYPLVAKVVSSDISHKSDVGGVVFPLYSREELVEAYSDILKRVRQNAPKAAIDGILIEEMIQGEFIETIVGVKRDPDFGPIILIGVGGIYVEVIKDIAQSLAPLNLVQATMMIRSLKCYPLLTGVRNGISYDIRALANALVRVSQFAMTMSDKVEEMEINPLIVFRDGQGVMALDGLLTVNLEW